jgi:hypothetical protein
MHLFPPGTVIQYGSIKLMIGVIGLVAGISPAYWLRIDGPNFPVLYQKIAFGIFGSGIWYLIIRLSIKRPLRKWLSDWWTKNMSVAFLSCRLNTEGKLEMELCNNSYWDYREKMMESGDKVRIILPTHGVDRMEDAKMVFVNEPGESILKYHDFTVKNITRGSDDEPVIVINYNPKSWMGDVKEFAVTMKVSDALKRHKLLRLGVEGYLNEIIWQRDGALEKYRTTCLATASAILGTKTKRFTTGGRGQNSKDAQSIRESLEETIKKIDQDVQEFAVPIRASI